MNEERVEQLKARLRSLQHYPVDELQDAEGNDLPKPRQFNMTFVADSCGTPACIAGHIMDMFCGRATPYGAFKPAADAIGLPPELVCALFAPAGVDLDEIKPHHAIAALEAIEAGATTTAEIWALYHKEAD